MRRILLCWLLTALAGAQLLDDDDDQGGAVGVDDDEDENAFAQCSQNTLCTSGYCSGQCGPICSRQPSESCNGLVSEAIRGGQEGERGRQLNRVSSSLKTSSGA